MFWLLFVAVLFLPLKVAVGQSPASSPQPAVIKAVAPTYPHIAAAKEIAGKVVVEAHINSEGVVSYTRSIDGPIVLRQTAEEAARKWLFAGDEHRSPSVIQLIFIFNIVSKNTASDELPPIFMPPHSVEVRTKVPELIFDKNVDPRGYVKPTKRRRRFRSS
ncbi:MAG TPA: energy transducer TonB [Pyrinomonadaceae bacterium]|jgi:hypothetical protein